MITKKQKMKLKQLKDKYFKIKTRLDKIQAISKNNERKILSTNKFYDDRGKRVLIDANNIADLNEFKRFLNLLYIENKKAGLQVTDPDLVPGWKERKELKLIEDQLLKLQLETLPCGLKKDIAQAQNHWKYRQKCLDLILKLAI